MGDKVRWGYAKLGGFAELGKGRTPSGKPAAYFGEKGTPWVKIENLRRKWVSASREYLTAEGERSGRTVPPGAVLLSVNRTIGKAGIAEVPLQTNEQIIAIVCKEQDNTFQEYLYYYLMFSAGILEKRAYVTVNSRISKGMLEDVIVPLADPGYRERCVAKLSLLEKLLWAKEDMLGVLKRYSDLVQRNGIQGLSGDKETCRTDLEHLTKLLGRSLKVTERLFTAALEQVFREAERQKEEIYYGGRRWGWVTIDQMEKLEAPLKALLKEMSFFQQCLYRAFYAAGTLCAIHTIVKQVKKREPSLKEHHIQDALAAVETFRQMGLMTRQEERKLYYTPDETEENEILGEDGSNLTISFWGCSFPGRDRGSRAGEGETT